MNFIKNGKEIKIAQLNKYWKLTYSVGKILVEVKLLISEYDNIDKVKELINENDLF